MNMITGAATATANRLPVLLFPADVFMHRRQDPVLQQIEHPSYRDASANDCFRPVSRFFDRVTRPEQLMSSLPEAMRVLADPAETGAVTISLPQDVQGEPFDFPASFFAPSFWPIVRRPPAEEEIATAIKVICNAQRPLIIVGGGVRYSRAEEEISQLSRDFGIPVTETFARKGLRTVRGSCTRRNRGDWHPSSQPNRRRRGLHHLRWYTAARPRPGHRHCSNTRTSAS